MAFHDRAVSDKSVDPPVSRPAVAESDMKDWAGGAKRSKAMPPWNMSPFKAWKGMLTRFSIGMKYGLNNWRKALSVPKAQWHNGEPGPGKGGEDNSALGFVRQFMAHGMEHLTNAIDLADKPVGATSEKGDTLMENLYAYLWNAATLVEYACENEDMFREAFSQYPEGSPQRRQDLQAGLADAAPWMSKAYDNLPSNYSVAAEPADVAQAVSRLQPGAICPPDAAPASAYCEGPCPLCGLFFRPKSF